MADEAVNEVLNGKIDYTLKHYLKFLEEVRLKAEYLTKIGYSRYIIIIINHFWFSYIQVIV